MKQEALKYFSETYLTSAGLLIFFLFFAGVLIWTGLRENKENYEKIKNLPLGEGGRYEQ